MLLESFSIEGLNSMLSPSNSSRNIVEDEEAASHQSDQRTISPSFFDRHQLDFISSMWTSSPTTIASEDTDTKAQTRSISSPPSRRSSLKSIKNTPSTIASADVDVDVDADADADADVDTTTEWVRTQDDSMYDDEGNIISRQLFIDDDVDQETQRSIYDVHKALFDDEGKQVYNDDLGEPGSPDDIHLSLCTVASEDTSPDLSNCQSIQEDTPPKETPRRYMLDDNEKEALLVKKTNFSFLAFGKVLTSIAIITALVGLITAICARKSLTFVKLEEPLYIHSELLMVERVGLNRVLLCYNQTYLIEQGQSRRRLNGDNTDIVSRQLLWTNRTDDDGCYSMTLAAEDIDDKMWNVARSFLSLAIGLGAFMCCMLIAATYWESINLKPVAMILLLTYFFQSLSFFFFDSTLCRDHICHLDEGSILSIVASIFWFFSALTTIRMDVLYHVHQRRIARRKKRAIKKLRLQRRISSNTTDNTATSNGTTSQSQRCRPKAYDCDIEVAVTASSSSLDPIR